MCIIRVTRGLSTNIIKDVLKFAAAGAAIGALLGFLCFGGGTRSPASDYSWAIIMAPTYAIIGAILGAANGLVFSLFRRWKK